MITDTIKKTIKSNGLISRGDKILIALSGGADSVCLTHALFSIKDELGITLYAAHLNHGIRGAEADRDEQFAKTFSEKLGIECFTMRADVPAISKQTGESEELAGRRVRYEFFDKICSERGIDKIATAHNKNDNAETIIMNFMRGSSIKGLGGIPYMRRTVIRPLLDTEREEIERYCTVNKLEYMTDSTNKELMYTRNKIRNVLIPLINENFNPNFIETVSSNAKLVREDSQYIEKMSEEAYKSIVSNNSVKTDDLTRLDAAVKRRVIRAMIGNAHGTLYDIPAVYVSDILSLLTKNSGASVNLSDGIVARIEYGRLIIEQEKTFTAPFEYVFNPIGKGTISEISKHVIISEVKERKKDGAIYLSCDEISSVTIRNRREGDVFCPCGMTGSKKVKELFINEKIPRDKRNTVPIIEINGNIAAVGDRVDRRFLFKDRGLRIEFKPIQEE